MIVLLGYWIKKINGVFTRHDSAQSHCVLEDEIAISKNLEKNIKIIKSYVGESADIIIRELDMGKSHAVIIYTDGLVNSVTIDQSIMKTLMYGIDEDAHIHNIDDIEKKLLISGELKKGSTLNEVIEGFLSGNTTLLIDGFSQSIIINTKGYEKRSIDDPQTDSVIRGPREAFIENLRTNTALLRRRIRSTALCIENLKVGRETKTDIAVVYLRDVANPELITKIKKRIEKTDIDAILDSGYIQQILDERPSSLFSTVGSTEKPDIAAAKILEGRAAVIVDGSPFVLTAPMYFNEAFQSPEDYYIHPYAATMLRIVRYLSFFISIIAMPGYVALTTYHHELIPMALLYTMAAADAGTPFPSFVEALIMIVVFEILKEAGVRLPKPVGQAVSIVGALVIGETAVSAGLIGAPMVIAVSITAVTAFVTPTMTNTIVILRYILLVLAAVMGGFGITIGIIGALIHLTALRSFGTPFLAPISPMRLSDLKDMILLAPLRDRLTRPQYLSRSNPIRQQYTSTDNSKGGE